jgi:hypothetical protein
MHAENTRDHRKFVILTLHERTIGRAKSLVASASSNAAATLRLEAGSWKLFLISAQ